MASVLEDYTSSGQPPDNPVYRNASLRFSGDPHYFYRALIFPPDDFSGDQVDPLVKIGKGVRFSIRYHLLFFRGTEDSPYQKVVDFRRLLDANKN